MEIDASWDLDDAVEFANNNSYIDSLILTTSGGLYTSRNTGDVAVWAPLTIAAAPGLAEQTYYYQQRSGEKRISMSSG